MAKVNILNKEITFYTLFKPVEFSPRNLKYMSSFVEAWPDRSIVQRAVAQIPWRSNLGHSKPMGIAEWETQITRTLPEDLKPSLPSIEEIEKELGVKE
jgi:hypothetical protein